MKPAKEAYAQRISDDNPPRRGSSAEREEPSLGTAVEESREQTPEERGCDQETEDEPGAIRHLFQPADNVAFSGERSEFTAKRALSSEAGVPRASHAFWAYTDGQVS